MRLRMALLICLAVGSRGIAQDNAYTVSQLKEPVPKSISGKVAELMQDSGYKVSGKGGEVICIVWPRKDLPIIANFQAKLDVLYPIEPGTLVGVIQFPAGGSDFRQQKIEAGAYTLRYFQQPVDGNHQGTADYRDFLVLCPPDADTTAEKLTDKEAFQLSKKVSGKAHPAIMSLAAPYSAPDSVPAIVQNDYGFEILVMKLTARAGGATKPVQLELVAVGHSDE